MRQERKESEKKVSNDEVSRSRWKGKEAMNGMMLLDKYL